MKRDAFVLGQRLQWQGKTVTIVKIHYRVGYLGRDDILILKDRDGNEKQVFGNQVRVSKWI